MKFDLYSVAYKGQTRKPKVTSAWLAQPVKQTKMIRMATLHKAPFRKCNQTHRNISEHARQMLLHPRF